MKTYTQLQNYDGFYVPIETVFTFYLSLMSIRIIIGNVTFLESVRGRLVHRNEDHIAILLHSSIAFYSLKKQGNIKFPCFLAFKPSHSLFHYNDKQPIFLPLLLSTLVLPYTFLLRLGNGCEICSLSEG